LGEIVNSKDEPATGEEPEELTWIVWPAAKRPWLSGAVAVFILALSAGVGWSFGDWRYGAVNAALLFWCLASHYLPARYRLDGHGVVVEVSGYRHSRPWSQVRACLDLGDRLILTAARDPGSVRAMVHRTTLRLPEGDAERVRAMTGAHVAVTRADGARA
jgi:hypothetical protein